MLDNMKYAGTMHLTLRGPDGEVKDERHQKNVLTDVGKTYLIQSTMDAGLTAMTVFYVGITATGAGGELANDTTASTNEIFRQAFTYSSGAVGAASATSTIASSGAGGATTTAITEAGIFNGLAGANSGDGVLFARAIFAAVNKGAADSLEVKWDISYS